MILTLCLLVGLVIVLGVGMNLVEKKTVIVEASVKEDVVKVESEVKGVLNSDTSNPSPPSAPSA